MDYYKPESHSTDASLFNISTIITLIILIITSFSSIKAQNSFQKGQHFYRQRALNAHSFTTDTANINKAISYFNTALDQKTNPEKSAAYLLQSYYFKGMYTNLPEDEQKSIYDTGRTLGEKMMEKYPDSVPIKFWYGANIGRWAKVHGFVQAATNGIAQKLRRVCKEIIALNPDYQGGGGYRILAQVHFYSPSIPLLMGWPEDKKALELIEKAMDIAPNHPTNRMLYAEILLEFDQKRKAKKQLDYIIEMEPRPSHLVEDRYVQHRSQKLLDKHF